MSLEALQLVRSLIDKGALEEASHVASSALNDPHNPMRGEALLALASAESARGHFVPALRLTVEAGEIFQSLGNAGGLCDALTQTAAVLRAAGDAATALSTLEHAENMARQTGDNLRVARVLRLVGVCASNLGRYQHALSCLTEAQALTLAAGRDDEERKVRLSLLNARDMQADSSKDTATIQAHSQAILAEWQQLADTAAENGETRLSVLAWGNHAISLMHAGDVHGAAAALLGLLPRYREFGMKANEALTHVELGNCLERLGDWLGAREQHQLALGILREAGVQDDLLTALEALSRCEEALGQPAAALAALRELRAIEKQRSDDLARQAVQQRELRIELARLTDRWAREALHDPLTGLPNRRALAQWFETHWPEVERGQNLTLLLLDLDHFKRVNDTHGHDVGDGVLKTLGQILVRHAGGAGPGAGSAHNGHLAVRYGGEEFLLLLRGVDGLSAQARAQLLLASIRAHEWSAVAPGLAITASLGLADAADVLSPQALLALADRRLYAAKYHGRDRMVSAG